MECYDVRYLVTLCTAVHSPKFRLSKGHRLPFLKNFFQKRIILDQKFQGFLAEKRRYASCDNAEPHRPFDDIDPAMSICRTSSIRCLFGSISLSMRQAGAEIYMSIAAQAYEFPALLYIADMSQFFICRKDGLFLEWRNQHSRFFTRAIYSATHNLSSDR